MKQLILCPYSYQKEILSDIRKNDIFCDVKFFSKEDIVSYYLGHFKKEARNYLIKKYNCSYETAIIYLSWCCYNLPSDSIEPKLKLLFDIKQDLLKNDFYIKENFYLEILKNQKVEIYGYSPNDCFFNRILNELHIEHSYHFNYEQKKEISPFHIFSDEEEEIHYLMVKICDLINDGVSVDDIYVYGIDEEYIDIFIRYNKMYHLPVNGIERDSLFFSKMGKDFLNRYRNGQSIESIIEYLNEKYSQDYRYSKLLDLIENNKDDSLNFDQQLDVYLYCLKNAVIPNDKYVHAINLIRGYEYLNNKHIFVVGFRQGAYPRIFVDNEFLNDNTKDKLHALTSKDKNIIAKDELLNFLHGNNNYYYSFSYRGKNGNHYQSFLKDNLALNEIKNKILNHDYSIDASRIELLKMKDVYYKYKEKNPKKFSYEAVVDFPYRNYDNQFKPFDIISKNQKLTHSYSSLSTFTKCPFSYYLEKILKIGEDDYNFNLQFGNDAHSFLQDGLINKSTDFEMLFNTHFKKENYKTKDWIFLFDLKLYLQAALITARKQLEQIIDPQIYLEKEISIPLNENSNLFGKIDKIIISAGEYVSLVDYKSGNEKFIESEVELHESLQLPTYGLFIKNDEQFKKYKLGGFYINNIFPESKDIPADDIDNPTYLKLRGRSLSDMNYIISMEPNFLKDGPKYIYSSNKNKTKIGGSTFIEKSTFDALIKSCLDHYLDCDDKIRNNLFEIAPRYFNERKNACAYCDYRDVCFRKEGQIVFVKKQDSEDEENG